MVTRGLRAILRYSERNQTSRILVDVTFVLLALALAVLIYRGAAAESRAAKQGKQAHDYLCYQKLVVIPARIQSTLKYQTEVQLGQREPIPGLTDADLASSIQRDQAVLQALGRVKCL